MSLLSQKKENERVAAEAAAKAKKEAILRDLAVHPVVKMGCSREVRDAYLYGIIVAAIANDDKIDSDERSILDHIANSMEIPTADVEETITRVNQMSVDEKLQLLEESVGAFKDQSDVVKFFYAQFAELWFTGEHNLGELKEIAGMLEGWSGVEFSTGRFKAIKAVVSNDSALNASLDDLAAWLGDDMLMRFAVSRYGNVSSRIEQSRKEKRDAAEAARRKAEQESQKASAEAELHKLQSEIVKECGGWGSMHSEWVQVIKKRMSAHHVELLDLKSEISSVLSKKILWRSWSVSSLAYQWGATQVERKKIGMIAVLIVCKYMERVNSFGRWGFIDDMFKTANRRSIRNELTQLTRSEFGVDG